MLKNNLSDLVLDTLKFTEQKIFLKQFHAERTFEALSTINSKTPLTEVFKIYDQIEAEYGLKISDSEVLRLQLTHVEQLNYEIEKIQKTEWPLSPKLQLLLEPKQHSGLGKNNYKWVDRPFWSEALKYKNPLADDIICANELGHVTETSRCNLFFYDKQRDLVFTPALSSGCINGVYRRFVMLTQLIELSDHGPKKVIESQIEYKKIATYEIYVANSVRGVLKAQLLFEK